MAIDRLLPRRHTARLLRPWPSYVEHALTAAWTLARDVDYVVADRKIWLVDASTGRLFDDRRWTEGLQHAVELKEDVPFSPPTSGAARITRQRYFTLYETLTGASGTLAEAADELRRTYRLPLRIVPPRLPSQRVEWPLLCFENDLQRLHAVVAEIAGQQRLGRPVLVGCRTIQASEALAALLHTAAIPHRVLNGRQTADEAQLVAAAGQAGAVTVATNLAGRGTDIRLDEAARRAGGLHVLGVERHDSRRVDRQLLGRAGRQGDPGSGRFFVSLDDTLLRPFPSSIARLRQLLQHANDTSTIAAEFDRCQETLEAQSRLRRNETTAADTRLDDLLAVLAKSE